MTWRELAWVSWSVRRGRARSCEYVWIAQSHSGRSSSLDARGPGPDLTWQRTLAVVVCAALARGDIYSHVRVNTNAHRLCRVLLSLPI
jgi:hypothetical protein